MQEDHISYCCEFCFITSLDSSEKLIWKTISDNAPHTGIMPRIFETFRIVSYACCHKVSHTEWLKSKTLLSHNAGVVQGQVVGRVDSFWGSRSNLFSVSFLTPGGRQAICGISWQAYLDSLMPASILYVILHVSCLRPIFILQKHHSYSDWAPSHLLI